ncbi:MAG: polysaccharide deacetylase family protein [Alphaproteobacteria bacterium]|nr:polysaccharide deacetylase family protein [Alphaproteobacteria bacterium]
MKPALINAALNTLYYSGAHNVLAPMTRGRGVIFMLHHATQGASRRADPTRFAPNRGLHVTPEFLDEAVGRIREKGFDIVSIDAAIERLKLEDEGRPFAALTFDDGYRDNLEIAYPTLKAIDCPFTVYVATAYPDGAAELWWQALEAVIAKEDSVEVIMDGARRRLECASPRAKSAAFDQLYPWLRAIDEDEQRRFVRNLAAKYDVSLPALREAQALTWDEVHALARDPLVTIGAHTVNHFAVAKLPPDQARREMADGKAKLEKELGRTIEHFAYPYGDENSAGPRDFEIAQSLGFKSAVTTRKGVLFDAHREHLHALPRVALNGDYQAQRYVDLYLTGAPFALFNRFKQVNVG